MRAIAILLVLLLGFAGCVNAPQKTAPAATVGAPALGALRAIAIGDLMNFTGSLVTPAVGTLEDLYEPTIEVSDTGTVYVAAHTIGAATTGTPAYFSKDDGKTFAPLPFVASVAAPSPLQGATPPPGDEGFIVAGENGQAWMADIYAAGFSVTGWCDNGGSQCYDDRQAYDRAGAEASCNPQSLNDRPWAAYGNGSLLLVNNAGGGPLQIGVMKVPPPLPVGLAAVNGPTWNFCASEGGDIPGVPTMRPDGLFMVPQMIGKYDPGPVAAVTTQISDDHLSVVIGNAADITKVKTVEVFPVTSDSDGTVNGGRTAFDRDGALYVGARNNTADKDGKAIDGRLLLAVSTDDGKTFKNATFQLSSPAQSLYLDSNPWGSGALLAWSQQGSDKGKADWYIAHVFVGPDGAPEVRDASLAIDEGPRFAAHVMGAAAGPDGRAYFVTFQDGAPAKYAGSTPLSVWVQQKGPTLPVSAAVHAHG